ncbi:MAG: energy transducer TonB [Chitinophagaceae bacterium]
MKPEMILESDMLDILFDGRNKEYGAYNLRRIYNNHLFKAMGGMLLLALLFAGFQFIKFGKKDTRNGWLPVKEDVILTSMEIPQKKQPEPVLPKTPAAPAKPVKTIAAATLKIVPDDTKVKPMATIDEILKPDVAVGTETKGGDNAVNGNAPAATSPAGNGTGTPVAEPPAEEKVVAIAEVMPQYPGGVEALRRFLAKNLRMPDGAVEDGQRVKIPTRFVVNKNGELTDVVLPGEVNEDLRKEILRVMHKMPRWIPGSQNGRTVAVYFSIPIIFENSGEQ